MEVTIVTPKKRVVEKVQAESVRVPAEKGEMEILPQHSEVLSTLTTGILEFSGRKFAISYGFLEVKDEQVTILAETCEESHEVDLSRAQDAEKRAREKLTGSVEYGTFGKHQLKLQRSLIRQQIAK